MLIPAQKRERVIIEGTVLHPPTIIQEMARINVRAENLFIHGSVRKLRENIRVTVYNFVRDFLPGDRIRFPARLRLFQNFNNPGRYNYEMAMRLKGLSCSASVSDGRHIVPMGNGDLGLILEMLENVRRPIRYLFKERLSPQNQALFQALILGERQGAE